MTIHAAKGLEFDVVFIAGCEDGIIPHARSLEEGEGNLEEERRLFYVALTRARRRLLVTLPAAAQAEPNGRLRAQPLPAGDPARAHRRTARARRSSPRSEGEEYFGKLKAMFGGGTDGEGPDAP